MAWRSSGSTNEELINNLFKNKLIKSDVVRDAMLRVDRAHFCPSKRAAYQDSPQVIAEEPKATISAPHMHASAAEHLLPYLTRSQSTQARPRVLDVGSGSGYLTAVFAEIVLGQSDDVRDGEVIGIEHITSLRDLGFNNTAKSARGRSLLQSGAVRFVVGDGRKGYADDSEVTNTVDGGFSAIHVGAGATEIHPELVAQLRSPGRMFIPVDEPDGSGDQYIWEVDKDEGGKVSTKRLYGVRYVPLTDAP